MPNNITVFTTNSCAYCAMVKRYLDAKKMKYEVVNMEEKPEAQQEVFKLTGSLNAPITIVEKANGERAVINGYKLPLLAAAIA